MTSKNSAQKLRDTLIESLPLDLREQIAAMGPMTDTEALAAIERSLSTIATEQIQIAPVDKLASLEPQKYELRGAALELQGCTDPEVLLSGPANTGKSLGCLLHVHNCCIKWPNVRALIIRKTRRSLTESALVTFEQKVLPPGCGVGSGAGRDNRHSYKYPNGSEIVVGGFDSPLIEGGNQNVRARVMSTDYDLVYVQEAIELNEKDWEDIGTRLRNNRMPFQQLLGDTNPDKPTHWLKRRCDAKMTRMMPSYHEDNPALWDARAKRWTEFAYRTDKSGYMDRLDRLTGPRRSRLRDGKWVQSEGVVYSMFNRALSLIDVLPAGYHEWPYIISVDFGYDNPFVAQWWKIDPDGRMYLYREIYMSKRIVEDHARDMKKWLCDDGHGPQAIVCDHDREGRATLERHLGWATIPALKSIEDGVNAVAERMLPSGNGQPRLYVVKDCLVERDGDLWDAKQPTCFEDEIDSYIRNPADKRKKDIPLDRYNHSMDAMRYAVMYANGFQAGEEFGLDTGDSLVYNNVPKGVYLD
jgi:PBSX family phage terminase large subunit